MQEVTASPPPLVPRRPARRVVPVGPVPRRKTPAVPPPVDSTPELDPIEQNRINEAVWVRQSVTDAGDNARPQLPERMRRSSELCARNVSSPALPFDLSQVVKRPDVHQCGLHHLCHDVVMSGVERLPQNHSTQANQLNSLSMFRQNIHNSLPRTLVPTVAADEGWPRRGVVTLPRWPIRSSTSPERDRVQSPGLAGLRIKSQDNDYVANPTLGAPHEVHSTESQLPRNLPTNDGTVTPSVVAIKSAGVGTDSSEKQHAKSTGDNKTVDCTSSGSLMCQTCGGCRCKSCADADRRVRSTIEFCSCAGPVRYLCQSDSGSEDAECLEEDPLDRTSRRTHRRHRCRHFALGVLVAALCLPCLCCYWPMKAGHEAVSACRRRFSGHLGVCRCAGLDCVNIA